jgi:hypothetical protein
MAAQPDTGSGSGEQARGCVGLKGSGTPAEGAAVGAAQRYAWLENLLPPVEEVRPGLWSIPVPWPGSGLRYTLAYLVSGPNGLALIDTGGRPNRPGRPCAPASRRPGTILPT